MVSPRETARSEASPDSRIPTTTATHAAATAAAAERSGPIRRRRKGSTTPSSPHNARAQLGPRARQLASECQRGCREPERLEHVLAVGAEDEVPLELDRLLRIEGVECEGGYLLVDH